ncbi:DoxX family protein [Actinomycetota bacterium Odt1-20B]
MTSQQADATLSTTSRRRNSTVRTLRTLHHWIQTAGESPVPWRIATVVARLALAAAFLSAVADRFGLWGEFGTGSVAWGTFDAFETNTAALAPYLSGWAVDAVAVAATVAELALGIALLIGVALRWTAWLCVGLLLFFGLSMAVFVDVQAPLKFAVFSGLAAALMLALAPRGSLVLVVDRRLSV